MKKIFLVGWFVITISSLTTAQQIFRLSQYLQHNFIFNPAASGANDFSSVGASYKKMWAGIDGGPKTALLFYDKYFDSKKVGFSGVIYDDKTGPTSRSAIDLNLSYSIPLNEKRRLMLGIGGQFMQHRIDKEAIAKYIPGDPLLDGPGAVFAGDASAGIYYKSPTFNVGFSIKQLVQSKLNFIQTSTNIEGKLYRHYFFMGSYDWKTDETNILTPNFLVKFATNAPPDIECGVKLDHKDLLWFGLNYHHKQSFSGFAGVKLEKKFAIGYSYDQFVTPLSIFDDRGNSHEISLRYFFVK